MLSLLHKYLTNVMITNNEYRLTNNVKQEETNH